MAKGWMLCLAIVGLVGCNGPDTPEGAPAATPSSAAAAAPASTGAEGALAPGEHGAKPEFFQCKANAVCVDVDHCDGVSTGATCGVGKVCCAGAGGPSTQCPTRCESRQMCDAEFGVVDSSKTCPSQLVCCSFIN